MSFMKKFIYNVEKVIERQSEATIEPSKSQFTAQLLPGVHDFDAFYADDDIFLSVTV